MTCESQQQAQGSAAGDDGGAGFNKLWYVGVIVAIIGSICSDMGLNMQKYSFMCEAKRSIICKRKYAKQPLWVFGLILVISGSVMDFVALGFLPQSLATPVGGATMVANVVFAHLFLREKFTRRDGLGTGLIVCGILIVATFANKTSECYTVEELVALYSEKLFVVYLVFVLLSCLVLYFLTKKFERLLKAHGSSSPIYKRFARIHPVTYPALSGMFGAQSVLLAKSAAELVKTTIEGTSQLSTVGTYVITLSMFVCVFLQIHWLAVGLQTFDAVFIVPVFQCFFISVSIFGGGVYFKEFSTMSGLALAMFFLGAAVTLSGVVLLSRRDMNVLRPIAKVRATVKMVIFIKRVQKARHMEYRWTQGTSIEAGCTVEAMVVKSVPSSARLVPNIKLSKASVMPIDSNDMVASYGESLGTATTPRPAQDHPNAPIEIVAKRFDK